MAEEEKKREVDRADGRPVGSKWERKRKSYEEGDNCRGRGGGVLSEQERMCKGNHV